MASPPQSFGDMEDAPSRVGHSSHMSFTSVPTSLSLTPSSPTLSNEYARGKSTISHLSERPDQKPTSADIMGQFSFAPATQTTVVTTTTTTTTSFPPLMMRAPNHLHQLDSKLYPLAASPTPQTLKRFCFDVGGKPTMFHEADDTSVALQKLQRQQKALQDSNGVLREVTSFRSSFEPPKSASQKTLTSSHDIQSAKSNDSFETRRSYGALKVSSGTAKVTGGDRTGKKQPNALGALGSENVRQYSSSQNPSLSRLQICQTSTPMTPSLDYKDAEVGQDVPVYQHRRLREQRWNQHTDTSPRLHARKVPQTLSPQPEGSMNMSFDTDDGYNASEKEDISEAMSSTPSYKDPTATASGEETLVDLRQAVNELTAPSVRPRPAVLDTAAAQDMSLPSPSLSPVTAAANLQHRRGYFEDINPTAVGRGSLSASLPDAGLRNFETTCNIDPQGGTQSASQARTSSSRGSLAPVEGALFKQQIPTPTMMDIPLMLDSFDAMPAEMKSYVMYQLLRRCPKPVLHFVVDVVNPTLKCDFLSLLPLELCQNVLGYLDVKSLCRAAQVSRKWRHIVNSDEKAWKQLFDTDGFVLPSGELTRAILEGWGWQYGSGGDDWEKDIGNASTPNNSNRLLLRPVDAELPSAVVAATPGAQSLNLNNKRSKRKAPGKSKSTSRKHQKKKDSSTNTEDHFDRDAFMKHMSEGSEGPYAAANEAAIAVPFSEIGLPSLRTLHLFKSIYQRHHLIRRNWMQDKVKPRHIAFKAHQRHVVTCLQFDSDKIITGSDDTNINVYDTRTGALRARLEGHEGGVWALQYEGNVLVSGSTDRSVRVWDIENGKCTQVFQGHTSTVRCLQILMPTEIGRMLDGGPLMMPNQPLIITGSRDSNLRVWKLPTDNDSALPQAGQSQEDIDCPYFVRTLTGHHHSVRAIAAYADTLVSGSYDCTVRVWKISTGETVHQLRGHTQKVYSVVLDHERNRCISGSMDNLVKVWSLDTGSVLFNLEGHSSLVGLLDLQHGRLVSAAADSTLRIWDPENGHCKNTLSAHTGAITCFQHDSQKVISGSDRTLKMWNVRDGELVRDLLTDLSGVWQVKFDERRCVAAVQRNNLTYIEVLDFGASRDGIPNSKRGRRIVVNTEGLEVAESHENAIDLDLVADD